MVAYPFLHAGVRNSNYKLKADIFSLTLKTRGEHLCLRLKVISSTKGVL